MQFPHLKTLIQSIITNLPAKASATAEAEDGAAINLALTGKQYHSGLAVLQVGDPTGAPTSFSIVLTIEESDDGVTWTTAKNAAGGDATATRTSAGASVIDFFPNQAKNQVRLSRETTITGGTSPRVPTAGLFLFGAGRDS